MSEEEKFAIDVQLMNVAEQNKGVLLAWCCKHGKKLDDVIKQHVDAMSKEVKKRLGGDPQSRLLTSLSANILTSFQLVITTDLHRMFKPFDIFDQCLGKQEQNFISDHCANTWEEITQTVLAEKDKELATWFNPETSFIEESNGIKRAVQCIGIRVLKLRQFDCNFDVS
ncbi:uncharacterized protein [Clytia hemisphaerica]|uniref:uncharacterized protein n=1 Tax=Clytia hemisphaerica TaxID=252671 RepID=UPI0034D5AFC7